MHVNTNGQAQARADATQPAKDGERGHATVRAAFALAVACLCIGCGGGGGDAPETQVALSPASATDPSVTVPPGTPGLREANGANHRRPTENVAPNLINVVSRGAALGCRIDLRDSAVDDGPCVNAVLRDAQTSAGSTLYFPDGTYNLLSASPEQSTANLVISKSFINLEGQSRAKTILKSGFDDADGITPYYGINVRGMHDIVLKNFTLTSTWNRAFSSDSSTNNPSAGGLTYGITTGAATNPAYNVVVDNVLVERFRVMAVRVAAGSYDVVIKNSVARDATDVGDGGSGYGFVIQGNGHLTANSNPYLGVPTKDTYFVTLEGNSTQGKHIRHAVILQYWAHNNLITNNAFDGTLLDSIDLHGEDEYANEISHNTVTNSLAAGIGLGNNGAQHDKTGPDNWLYRNDLVACAQGISVQYGTERTTIEANTIRGNAWATGSPAGVVLGKSAKSVLRNNVFRDNPASKFAAVVFIDNGLTHDEPPGGPSDWVIRGNLVVNSGQPILNKSTSESNNEVQTSW